MELTTVLNMVENTSGVGVAFDRDNITSQKIMEVEVRTEDLYKEDMVEFVKTMLEESEIDTKERIYKVDVFDEWGDYIELRWWIA